MAMVPSSLRSNRLRLRHSGTKRVFGLARVFATHCASSRNSTFRSRRTAVNRLRLERVRWSLEDAFIQYQTEKEEPQPQVVAALGLRISNWAP